MKTAETLMQQRSLMVEENMPPVRGSNCSVQQCKVKKMASVIVHAGTCV